MIDYLLHELLPNNPPRPSDGSPQNYIDSEAQSPGNDGNVSEGTPLLYEHNSTASTLNDDPLSNFVGLNALEIAAIADAKKFLSQGVVQKIVDGIWNGRIIFWETLSVHSTKKANIYNKKRADPYSRLRVPKYQKGFEALFFALFLVLYYAVLVERNPYRISPVELLLYIWIAAFAYDEFGEYQDAGRSFYATDFWSLWDVGIIGIGFAYMISRKSFDFIIQCLWTTVS